MTVAEKRIARELRQHVERIEPIKARGTLEDYFTVYADYTTSQERQQADYSKAKATRLYQAHGFEYCVLLEVLAGCR